MSHSVQTRTIRDALYEAPGPKTHRKMLIGTVITALLVALAAGLIVHRFYVTGQFAPRYWTFFTQVTTWTFLFEGFKGTLEVSVVAGIISLILGLVLMLGRTSKLRVLSLVCRVVTDFFRGVPSLLLIYFFFLIIPQYGLKMDSFWMITLPVALAASGVLAEVFRAGVNAVPVGQTEAAESLGMMPAKIMRKIVLPQAIRYVIPTLISQLVVVVKDTTVAYVVSYPDLLQNARVLITNYDSLVSVYFVIAIIYIVLNYLIHRSSLAVSRKLGVKIID